MQFVHLHNHSYYSFLDGLSSPKGIIERAIKLGQPAVALTDHGNLAGAYKFYQASLDQGNKEKPKIKAIIGCEVYICHQSREIKTKENRYYHLVLLAENNAGYHNLLNLVTASNLTGFYGKPRIDFDLLKQHSNGLIALSACIGGAIPQAYIKSNPIAAKEIALSYIDIFGKDNFFLEVQKHDDLPDQLTVNASIVALARELNIGLVATNDCHYLVKEDAQYRDELSLVSKSGKFQMAAGDYSMLSTSEMIDNFKDLPEAIENTVKIANRCNVTIEKSDRVPRYPTPNAMPEADHLQELCELGLYRRYGMIREFDSWTTKQETPKPIDEIVNRYEHELKIITDLGFAGYFLIVQDYIAWAKSQNIYVGPAKGSAAGSLISYLLRITEIDPLPYNLLFERFLNPERKEMPDIDTDFQDDRRNEVIEYVRQKYGTENVSLVSAVTTLASKNAIRTAARGQGISFNTIQPILLAISDREAIKQIRGDNDKENLNLLLSLPKAKALYETNPTLKTTLEIAKKFEGVPRSVGTHACAVIISNQPIGNFTPLQKANSKSNTVITQFEAGDLASLGCLKMDFLGIKTLTAVSNTLNDIHRRTGTPIDLNALSLNDQNIFKYLSTFNATGIYQFESEGMQQHLHDLQPDCIQHLIAMNAMYRPGPIQYIPSFIKRKNGEEAVTYDHPIMERVLKETYGITVYQEQVMQLSVELAGFTQSQADDLRKAISKKDKNKLNSLKTDFSQGCKNKNNLSEQLIEKIWNDWLSFASYAFNKSHAAAYAILAYQTAYLKYYHPAAYMKNLLNAYENDFKTLLKYMAEVKRMGIELRPPDINLSYDKFSICDNAIVVGFNAVKSVRKDDIAAIITERANGAYTSLGNLYSRVITLKSSTIKSLALCGALETLCPNRRGIIHTFKRFSTVCREFSGVALDDFAELHKITDYDDLSKATFERNLLGFYATINPFIKHQTEIRRNSILKPVAKSIFNRGKTYHLTAIIDDLTIINKSHKQPVTILKVSTCYGSQETIIISSKGYFKIGRHLIKNKIYNFKVTASFKNRVTTFFLQACTLFRLANMPVIAC